MNLSAKYVADSLDITTRAYSNIENNVSDISFSKLEKLSEIFNVPVSYIVNYKSSDSSGYFNSFHNHTGAQQTNHFNQGLQSNELMELFNKFINALSDFKKVQM